MPHFDRDNLSLYYESIGDHPTALLFIHGSGGDHAVWKYQVEHFRRRYQIVSLDLLGHGQSSREVDPVMVPRTDAVIIDRLMRDRIGKPYFAIGHSFAGFIMPELIKLGDPNLMGAVFIDCVFPGFRETVDDRIQFGRLMMSLTDEQLEVETARWYSRLIGPGVDTADKEFILSSLRHCRHRWLFQTIAGCRDFITAHPPGETPVKDDIAIFIIEADHGVGGDLTKSWINHFREAEYYLIENAYHFPFITTRDRFNIILDRFLADHNCMA